MVLIERKGRNDETSNYAGRKEKTPIKRQYQAKVVCPLAQCSFFATILEGLAMRYKIIDLSANDSMDFINLTVAAFSRKDNAIAVCRELPIHAEVIDALENTTLFNNWRV